MTTIEEVLYQIRRLRDDFAQLKADLVNKPTIYGLWDENKQEWATDQWLKTAPVVVFSTLEGAIEAATRENRFGYAEWLPKPYQVVAPESATATDS